MQRHATELGAQARLRASVVAWRLNVTSPTVCWAGTYLFSLQLDAWRTSGTQPSWARRRPPPWSNTSLRSCWTTEEAAGAPVRGGGRRV